MVYSCGGFSRCFRVCRFYDVEVRPGHFWGIRSNHDFTGSPSGRGIWSTHACDDKKSLKRFFWPKRGEGGLGLLKETTGNCWKPVQNSQLLDEWKMLINTHMRSARACVWYGCWCTTKAQIKTQTVPSTHSKRGEPKMLENWGVLSWRTFYLLRLEGLWRSRRLELPPTDDPPSQSPVCTNYFIHCTSLHFTLHQVTYIVIVSYSDIWIWIKSVLLYMLWNHSWIYRTK